MIFPKAFPTYRVPIFWQKAFPIYRVPYLSRFYCTTTKTKTTTKTTTNTTKNNNKNNKYNEKQQLENTKVRKSVCQCVPVKYVIFSDFRIVVLVFVFFIKKLENNKNFFYDYYSSCSFFVFSFINKNCLEVKDFH